MFGTSVKNKNLDLRLLENKTKQKPRGNGKIWQCRAQVSTRQQQTTAEYGLPTEWGLPACISVACLALEGSVGNAGIRPVVLNPEYLEEL